MAQTNAPTNPPPPQAKLPPPAETPKRAMTNGSTPIPGHPSPREKVPPPAEQFETIQPLDGMLYGSLRVHLALGLSSAPRISDGDWGLPCVAPEYVAPDADESRFREALKQDYTVETLKELCLSRCRSAFKKSIMQRRACEKRAEIDRKICASFVQPG